MKRALWPLAMVLVPVILGATGVLLTHVDPRALLAPPDTVATLRPQSPPPATPAVTSTASPGPRATVTAPRPAARRGHRRTGPWAVVRAYYRDVDARDYAKAWALISPALATGQTYQQFVAGYACTGTEHPAELSQSGHQAGFSLVVVNACTGAAQRYLGTDTVRGGKIVTADVTPTG
jgi:hypothetical protein